MLTHPQSEHCQNTSCSSLLGRIRTFFLNYTYCVFKIGLLLALDRRAFQLKPVSSSWHEGSESSIREKSQYSCLLKQVFWNLGKSHLGMVNSYFFRLVPHASACRASDKPQKHETIPLGRNPPWQEFTTDHTKCHSRGSHLNNWYIFPFYQMPSERRSWNWG